MQIIANKLGILIRPAMIENGIIPKSNDLRGKDKSVIRTYKNVLRHN